MKRLPKTVLGSHDRHSSLCQLDPSNGLFSASAREHRVMLAFRAARQRTERGACRSQGEPDPLRNALHRLCSTQARLSSDAALKLVFNVTETDPRRALLAGLCCFSWIRRTNSPVSRALSLG